MCHLKVIMEGRAGEELDIRFEIVLYYSQDSKTDDGFLRTQRNWSWSKQFQSKFWQNLQKVHKILKNLQQKGVMKSTKIILRDNKILVNLQQTKKCQLATTQIFENCENFRKYEKLQDETQNKQQPFFEKSNKSLKYSISNIQKCSSLIFQ